MLRSRFRQQLRKLPLFSLVIFLLLCTGIVFYVLNISTNSNAPFRSSRVLFKLHPLSAADQSLISVRRSVDAPANQNSDDVKWLTSTNNRLINVGSLTEESTVQTLGNIEETKTVPVSNNVVLSSTEAAVAVSETVEKRLAILCYVAVSTDDQFVMEFTTMLYSSWRYAIKHPKLVKPVQKPANTGFSGLTKPVLLDLLVFCEPEACGKLPGDCIESSGNVSAANVSYSTSTCRKLALAQHGYAKEYPYINALALTRYPGFHNVIKHYDFLLRTDLDTMITPAIRYWLPNSSVAIGYGAYSSTFSQARLPLIASRLGLQYQQVHNIGSTVGAQPEVMFTFLNLVLNLTIHFFEAEFRKEDPELAGIFEKNSAGKWPEWWKWVSSMYASELALNHLVPGLGAMRLEGILDTMSSYATRVMDVVHIHCFHNPEPFHKFFFKDALKLLRSSKVLDPRLLVFHLDANVVNMTVAQYSTYMAWHGAANYVNEIRELIESTQDTVRQMTNFKK